MAQEFQRQIVSQDIVVSINRTSQIAGGLATDLMSIDSVIQMSSGEAQDIVLAYPSDEADPQQAYLRVLGDVETRLPFQPPVPLEQLSDDLRTALTPFVEEERQRWDNLQRLISSLSVNRINLKAGDTELKFFRQKQITAAPDGAFRATFMAPFAGLHLQGGGSMSLVVLLPRGAQLIGVQVDATPDGISAPQPLVSASENRVTLHCFLHYDPMFTITYKY